MKKLFAAALALIIFSCNSGDKKTEETTEKNVVGVPNTDGTIPDTTNAIDLSTQKKDTTQTKDSVK